MIRWCIGGSAINHSGSSSPDGRCEDTPLNNEIMPVPPFRPSPANESLRGQGKMFTS
jgi:hypothetical protein